MTGCPCPHEANEHATAVEFGQRICLVAGCDCNGTHEEVEAAYMQRWSSKRRVLHDLTDVVRAAIDSPLGPIRGDDIALTIAAEILEKFNVEKK